MKLLSQLIALYLPGAGMLQVMMIIAAATLLFKTAAGRFAGARKRRTLRRKTREMENNMWAIE